MKSKLFILYYYLLTLLRPQTKVRVILERRQHHKVKKHLKKVRALSVFFADYYQGLDNQKWTQFPVMDKNIMMAHFDKLNTLGLEKKTAFDIAIDGENKRDFSKEYRGITVGLSSGTSGNRGLFLASEKERALWAGAMLAKVLPKPIIFDQKIALFLRANSNLYETVKTNKIKFEYFDLFEPLEKHIAQLNQYQPTLLVAPPSMLRLLSTAVAQGTLKITPQKIVSAAEVLDPMDREYIENQFRQALHQIYQATEGFLGITCKYGTLHLNEDLVCIQKEYLDEEKIRFVPIITDFNRITQPIIRYRLNDILIEKKEPCPCGSIHTAIEAIEGRTDDLFYGQLENLTKTIPVFPDFIRNAIISAAPSVKEYRAVQTALDKITISIKCDAEVWDESVARITTAVENVFERMQCTAPAITCGEYLEQDRIKKLRRISRNFNLD